MPRWPMSSSRAAVCIDNARRFTQQQSAALTLQRSLLPSAVSDLPGGRGGLPISPGEW